MHYYIFEFDFFKSLIKNDCGFSRLIMERFWFLLKCINHNYHVMYGSTAMKTMWSEAGEECKNTFWLIDR